MYERQILEPQKYSCTIYPIMKEIFGAYNRLNTFTVGAALG
jgi:hypothetical protein